MISACNSRQSMPHTFIIICCQPATPITVWSHTSAPSIFEIHDEHLRCINYPLYMEYAPWNMGLGLLLEVIAFQTWYILLSSAPCASRAHYTSQLLVIVTGGHCPQTFSTSSPKINNIRHKLYFVSNQACRETTGGLGQNGWVEAPWMRQSRVHSERVFLLIILWSLSVY